MGLLGLPRMVPDWVPAGTVLSNNTWAHIGYTFNSSGSVKTLYINGSSVSTVAEAAGDFSANTASLGGELWPLSGNSH